MKKNDLKNAIEKQMNDASRIFLNEKETSISNDSLKIGQVVNHKYWGKCEIIKQIDKHGYVVQSEKKSKGEFLNIDDWDLLSSNDSLEFDVVDNICKRYRQLRSTDAYRVKEDRQIWEDEVKVVNNYNALKQSNKELIEALEAAYDRLPHMALSTKTKVNLAIQKAKQL